MLFRARSLPWPTSQAGHFSSWGLHRGGRRALPCRHGHIRHLSQQKASLEDVAEWSRRASARIYVSNQYTIPSCSMHDRQTSIVLYNRGASAAAQLSSHANPCTCYFAGLQAGKTWSV